MGEIAAGLNILKMTAPGIVNDINMAVNSSGDLLGRTETLASAPTAPTTDPLSGYLDRIRTFAGVDDDYGAAVSELRGLTGAQGANEAWGGRALYQCTADPATWGGTGNGSGGNGSTSFDLALGGLGLGGLRLTDWNYSPSAWRADAPATVQGGTAGSGGGGYNPAYDPFVQFWANNNGFGGSFGWYFPVALDLDGDGVELIPQQDSHAWYDVKGDGFSSFEKTDGTRGWAADVGLGYEDGGWKSSVDSNLVRMTQSGGLVYGLARDNPLALDLGAQSLDGAFGGAGNDVLSAGDEFLAGREFMTFALFSSHPARDSLARLAG